MEFTPEEIAQITGQSETTGFSNLNIPILQLNSKTGDYGFIENKEENIIGQSLIGVIVKVRSMLKFVPENKSYTMWTGESDGSTIVPLWIKTGSQKATQEGRMTLTDWKKKYDFLKKSSVLYVQLKDSVEVSKLTVSGKSFFALLDYYKQFSKEKGKEEHTYQFYTNFISVKNDYQGKDYWAMNFIKGEKVEDKMAILIKAKELTDNLIAYESQFSGNKTELKEQDNTEEIDVDKMLS